MYELGVNTEIKMIYMQPSRKSTWAGEKEQKNRLRFGAKQNPPWQAEQHPSDLISAAHQFIYEFLDCSRGVALLTPQE